MGLEVYMQAFMELSSCRSVGFGEGPIPWREISWYAHVEGFVGDQETALFYHTRALDNVYLQFKGKQTKVATSGKGTGISAKAPRSSS